LTTRTRILSLALLAGVVAVSSALAARSDTTFTVASSIDGKTVLPLRSHWIASPNDTQPIDHVDFFIDGYHAWTQHQAPWYFGGQGNWLITTFLKPGLHKFVVRAYDTANQTAVDTVQARVVGPPAPPARLAGSWKSTSPRPFGLAGTLLIAKNGWTLGPNNFVDAQYLSNGSIVLGPQVIDRPEQGSAPCGSYPPHTWKATIANGDKSMTLAPVGTDPCAIRTAIFKATWTRSH
jgi:hypothetical protein